MSKVVMFCLLQVALPLTLFLGLRGRPPHTLRSLLTLILAAAVIPSQLGLGYYFFSFPWMLLSISLVAQRRKVSAIGVIDVILGLGVAAVMVFSCAHLAAIFAELFT